MLTSDRLAGARFAVNVGIATVIVWQVLWELGDTNPVWAIASMIAASEPEPDNARRMFRCRLINVVVGSIAGLVFLLVGGVRPWVLPLALATTTAISSYVIRVQTMWRQAPITAAVVIASGLMHDSARIGIVQGLHKVAEVMFGCLVGLIVSLVMAKVWLIRSRDRGAGGDESRMSARGYILLRHAPATLRHTGDSVRGGCHRSADHELAHQRRQLL